MTAPIPTPLAPPASGQGVVSSGWLAANSTFEHKDERKLGRAAVASLGFHGLLLFAILFVMSIKPEAEQPAPLPEMKADLVYLDMPGPGGGGGGSPAPAPPKKLEIPKSEPVAAPPVAPVPVPVVPPPPDFSAPVMTNSAQLLQASGVSSVSLASLGGGGRGSGIGPGQGPGLGPGSGGGTGGGVYGPGNGVTSPVPIIKRDPTYTSEAMRAKTQGEVWIEAVVLENGTVGEMRIVKSLDRVNGLDESALATAKTWLFRPGTKDGVPVKVRVTLILEFRLH